MLNVRWNTLRALLRVRYAAMGMSLDSQRAIVLGSIKGVALHVLQHMAFDGSSMRLCMHRHRPDDHSHSMNPLLLSRRCKISGRDVVALVFGTENGYRIFVLLRMPQTMIWTPNRAVRHQLPQSEMPS